jgi:hypothetical protein
MLLVLARSANEEGAQDEACSSSAAGSISHQNPKLAPRHNQQALGAGNGLFASFNKSPLRESYVLVGLVGLLKSEGAKSDPQQEPNVRIQDVWHIA